MKGTVSPEMRMLLNNRELREKFFIALRYETGPFVVSDSKGNSVKCILSFLR